VIIRILAHYGYARAFFNLAVPSNDDGLRAYLLDHGVDWEQVLFYYEISIWDPVRFAGGFLLGLGFSAAAILEVAKELFDFGIEALTEPTKAATKIRDFVDGIRQLSIESLVAAGKEAWVAWDKEFSQALFDLDFDKAGVMLGKLAGDLWQLLTGIRALAKLPGMTMKLARRFAALFAKGARASRTALALLADLLRRLAVAIRDAAQWGYGVIADFFDDIPQLVKQLENGALALVDRFGNMMIAVPDGLVLEGIGAVDEGFLLAQQSEGVTNVVARVRVQFEKGLKYAQSLGPAASKKIKKARLSLDFARSIRRAEQLAAEYLKEWRNTLQKILTENKIPLNPREIGQWIHDHLEQGFKDLAAAMSKTHEALPEIQIRSLAKQLASSAAELKAFVQRANTNLLAFAKGTPRMYEALGVADEKGLIKFLKAMGYEDPSNTLIGDLISDGVLFNRESKQLISVDWTSGLGRYRYANEFEKVMKAGESLSEADKLALAQKFLKHTFREYALREAILAFVFDGWETKVLEVMYEPFKLVR
jgi:hypothetical protein